MIPKSAIVEEVIGRAHRQSRLNYQCARWLIWAKKPQYWGRQNPEQLKMFILNKILGVELLQSLYKRLLLKGYIWNNIFRYVLAGKYQKRAILSRLLKRFYTWNIHKVFPFNSPPPPTVNSVSTVLYYKVECFAGTANTATIWNWGPGLSALSRQSCVVVCMIMAGTGYIECSW